MTPTSMGGMDLPDLSIFVTGTQGTDTGSTVQGAAPITTGPKDSISQSADVNNGDLVYQAAPGQPQLSPTVTLSAPTNVIPVPGADQEQDAFMAMAAKLPPGLRSQLMKEIAKPPEQQSTEMWAVQANLQEGAFLKVWGDQILAGQPLEGAPQPGSQKAVVEPPGQPAIDGSAQIPGADGFAGAPMVGQPGTLGGTKLDPATMSPEQLSGAVRGNALDALDNQTKVIAKTIQSLPDSDPNKPMLMEFLKFISQIIDECKKFLHELVTMDAVQGKKAAIAMKETQCAKLEKQMKDIEKAQEMKKKADTLGTILKIAGPIIAIAMVALVIVSGGSAIAIAIAVIMVVVALIAATTTIIDDVMKKVVDEIKTIFLKMGFSEEVAAMLTALVMIIMIIALMVATRGACSCGTGLVTEQLGAEAAKQATSKVATGMAMEVGAVAIGHSKVINIGLKPFLTKFCGMDEKTAELICMIVTMITMLVLALGGAAAMASAATTVSRSATGTMGRSMENIAERLQEFSTAVQALTQAYSAVANLLLAQKRLEKGKLEEMITEIKTAQNIDKETGKARQDSMAGLMDLVAFYSDSFTQILQSMQQVVGKVTSV